MRAPFCPLFSRTKIGPAFCGAAMVCRGLLVSCAHLLSFIFFLLSFQNPPQNRLPMDGDGCGCAGCECRSCCRRDRLRQEWRQEKHVLTSFVGLCCFRCLYITAQTARRLGRFPTNFRNCAKKKSPPAKSKRAHVPSYAVFPCLHRPDRIPRSLNTPARFPSRCG